MVLMSPHSNLRLASLVSVFVAFALAAFGQANLPNAPVPITGSQAMTARTSIAWAEGLDGGFRIWRVQVSGTRASKKGEWTSLKIPAELASFTKLHSGERTVCVNFAMDGTLRVLWLVADYADPEGNRDGWGTGTLYQAESHDDGTTWQVFRSLSFADPPTSGVSIVDEVAMADSQHGWATLTEGSEMNSVPEILLATSDGGQHWQLAASVIGVAAYDKTSHGGLIPIGGRASPRLLIAHSAKAASLVAEGGEDFEGYRRYAVAHTEDGGRTWALEKLPQHPWCADCVIETLRAAVGTKSDGRRSCFDAIFRSKTGNGARFCSSDGGRVWGRPTRR
jgi:hypothetical protein